MAGRTSNLTPAVHSKIVAAVRAGNFYRAAAAYAGISKSSLYGWLERGNAEKERIENGAAPDTTETRYLELLDALTRAEAEAEIEAVANWKSQTRTDWRAAKDWLARRHSDEWGDKAKVEVTGTAGGPITLQGLAALMHVPTDSTEDDV